MEPALLVWQCRYPYGLCCSPAGAFFIGQMGRCNALLCCLPSEFVVWLLSWDVSATLYAVRGRHERRQAWHLFLFGHKGQRSHCAGLPPRLPIARHSSSTLVEGGSTRPVNSLNADSSAGSSGSPLAANNIARQLAQLSPPKAEPSSSRSLSALRSVILGFS